MPQGPNESRNETAFYSAYDSSLPGLLLLTIRSRAILGGERGERSLTGEKTRPTKERQNPLDSERPSYGMPFRQLRTGTADPT